MNPSQGPARRPPRPRFPVLNQRFPSSDTNRSPPTDDSAASHLSERKIAELRRSLFVPSIPSAVSAEELAAGYRFFGNIQEIFVRDAGSHRFSIVIFVEEETAYDVLAARVVIKDNYVYAEPRKISGRIYAPRVPMETETPVRIQTSPGGRGVPFSIVADYLPIVNGSAYFHPTNADGTRNGGPAATRAPLLTGPPRMQYANMLMGQPLVLPMITPPLQGQSTIMRQSPNPVLDSMPFLRHSSDGLEQMILLVKNVELSQQELVRRDDMRRDLENLFRKIFRKCSIRLYGSSVNTFGVRGSDIDAFLDLYLDTEEAQRVIPPRERGINYFFNNVTQLYPNPYEPAELRTFPKTHVLRLMEKYMRYCAKSMRWDDIVSIPEARTPILRLYQNFSGMSVDISFSSNLVFQNTGLLIMYSHMDTRVRPLVYTIRRWAELKGLTGDHGFTKYALTMLLIFFLQQTKPVVLPPPDHIALWMEQFDEGLPNGNAPFSFDRRHEELVQIAQSMPPSFNEKSTADLLLEFFSFYSNLSFEDNVMCCWNGELIPKETFPVPEDGFRFRYVNLQDPFDLAHNIAKSVTLQVFVTLREQLRREVAVFTRRALDLAVLFDKNHFDGDFPVEPVMVSISGYKSAVPAEIWIPTVADLAQNILRDFFACDFVREITKTEKLPYDRFVPKLGPILKDLHCKLSCLSWIKRRNVRKQLTKKRKYIGLKDEWELEATIGEKLREGTQGKVSFDFYVTIMVNAVESDRVCMFLSCPRRAPEVSDFFELLWKFLPEQIRRFLKMDEVIIEPASDAVDGESSRNEPHDASLEVVENRIKENEPLLV